MKTAALSDPGLKRANNEDAWALNERVGLLLVADGMGGHAAGEVASHLVVGAVGERLGALPEDADPLSVLHALAESLNAADQAVLAGAAEDEGRRGMGAAVTVALVRNGFYHLAQVGDTRAYLLREGRLLRLTRDHTAVEEQVTLGVLTRTAAARSPYRHVLTRAVGAPGMSVDLYRGAWREDDLLLLSSDGLHDKIEESAIAAILQSDGPRPELAAQKLIAAANAAGGEDNITVVLAAGDRFTGASAAGDDTAQLTLEELAPPTPRTSSRRSWLGGLALLVMLGVGLDYTVHSARPATVWWALDSQRPCLAAGSPRPAGKALTVAGPLPRGFEPRDLKTLLTEVQDLTAWAQLVRARFHDRKEAEEALRGTVKRAVAMAAIWPPPPPGAAKDERDRYLGMLSRAVQVGTPFARADAALQSAVTVISQALSRETLEATGAPTR